MCSKNNVHEGTIARSINEIRYPNDKKVSYKVYQNDLAFINERILEIKRSFD